MIIKFEVGKKYTFNPPAGIKSDHSIFRYFSMFWAESMFVVLDGKPRLCTRVFPTKDIQVELEGVGIWRWFPTTLEYWNKVSEYIQGEMEV